jgi:hypothetical protein
MTNEEIEKLDGPALAAAVAERVMGWKLETHDHHLQDGRPVPFGGYPVWRMDKHTTRIAVHWRPDQGIAQAFEVIEKLHERHPDWWFGFNGTDDVGVWQWSATCLPLDLASEHAEADTLPVAILRMALMMEGKGLDNLLL